MAETNGSNKWINLYRGAVILLIGVAGYFLQDAHSIVKESAQDVGDLKTEVATIKGDVKTLQRQTDLERTESDRRFDALERWRDTFPARR